MENNNIHKWVLFLCLNLRKKEVNAIIKDKFVILKWRNSNKKRYESMGYNFTQYGDEFKVKIEDVPKRSNVEITVICEYCRIEKQMSIGNYNNITKNGSKKYRCRECFLKNKILRYCDVVDIIQKAGYELITKEDEYVNGKSMITYKCPVHGIHKMQANNLNNGKRCPECHFDNARKRFAFSSDKAASKIESLGGKLINKNEYINNSTKNLKILCPSCHENVFITSLRNFEQHGGQSCPECSKKESVGERRIRQWLEKTNISFIQEKRFPDCRDINPLPFDFYLPSKNTIIEFDGIQHFKETHFFPHTEYRYVEYGGSIKLYTQKHDSIKNNYCKINNINLIRIPYTDINKIENVLQEKLIA